MAARVKTKDLEIDNLGVTDTLDFLHGSTESNKINIKGVLADSLSIVEDTDKYLTFNTSDATVVFGQNATFAGKTITDLGTVTTADINGGSIDNVPIGSSTAAAGNFTTITASTSLDVTGSTGIILENDQTITNSTAGTVIINGVVAAGTGASTAVFKSNGDYDVTLKTGNSTTGSITITDGANGDIAINPDGTGNVSLGTLEFDADQTVGPEQDNYVLTYDNSLGLISLEASSGGGASTMDGLSDVSVAGGDYTISDLDNLIFNGGKKRILSIGDSAANALSDSATTVFDDTIFNMSGFPETLDSESVKSVFVKVNVNVFATIDSINYTRTYVINGSFVPTFSSGTLSGLTRTGVTNNFATGNVSTDIFDTDLDLSVTGGNTIVLGGTGKQVTTSGDVYVQGTAEIIILTV